MNENVEETIADVLKREEEKKRFLGLVQSVSTASALTLMAERIFNIESFQQTQNHNSTVSSGFAHETRNMLDTVKTNQKWELLLLVPVAGYAIKAIIFGNTASATDVVSLIKALWSMLSGQ